MDQDENLDRVKDGKRANELDAWREEENEQGMYEARK